MNFSDRVKKCLAEAGMDAAELARRISVSRTTIKYWVDGTTIHPRPEHLFPAARELRVSPEWLSTGKGERRQLVQAAQERSAYVVQHLTDRQKTLLQEIEALPQNVADAVFAFVRTLNNGAIDARTNEKGDTK